MLTVVSGPPGAGKTTALAQWAASASRRAGAVAWLTLDEYDNTADRFWQHLAAALTKAGIPLPADGFAGVADGPLQVAAALTARRPPLTLVLDNLHLLRAPGPVEELSYLLGQVKPGLKVVAGTRTDQPLPLQRHVLTGDLAEVHGAQLAFTGAETKLLLQRCDITRYRQSILQLLRQTEGWAAGLRFALAELGDTPGAEVGDPVSRVQLINGYLATEAFDTQSPRTRDFLLRCSVPKLITPDLASALTGQADSAAMLADLVGANLFVELAGGGAYRYHTLFRELLLTKLRTEEPELHRALLRRSAEWCWRHGRLADAIRHAASAGDGQLAARITVDELAVSRLFDADPGGVLLGDLTRVPATARPALPQELVFAAVVATKRHEYGSAASWLARADEALRSLRADQGMPARLAAAGVRFSLARSDGDPDALYAAAAEQERALGGLPSDVRERRPDLTTQARSDHGYAAFWLGRFDEAEKVLAGATPPSARDAVGAEGADCHGRLALAEALSGHLGRAMELAVRSARTGPRSDAAAGRPEPPLSASSGIALAWVQLQRAEIAGARSSLKRVETALRTHPDRAAAALATLIAAYVHLVEGRHATAISSLARVRQDWSPPAWLDRELAVAEARAQSMAGDAEAALDALDRCGALPGVAALTTRAHAWLAEGKIRSAQREMKYAFNIIPERPDRMPDRVLIDALLADARIHYACRERAAGHGSLVRALRVARTEAIRLPFVLEHSWLFPVFRADAELGAKYRALADSSTSARVDAAPQSLSMAGTALVEPLTEREREVLLRAAQMLSTDEIAKELYISVNTVKTHLKSVHRKLAVTQRREAVRRARQLNLL